MSLAREWGSTAADRALAFPCNRHLRGPADALYRAIDVDAPPAVLFRWLCQLRVAPYSYDWIDNLGRTSPRTLTPGLEDLRIGQRVMTIFNLVEFEVDRHLTLVLHRASAIFGEIACTYLVVPRPPDRSRLVVKMLCRYPRVPVVGALVRVLLPWGDLVMMRKQLLTLKELAEAQERARATSSSARVTSSAD